MISIVIFDARNETSREAVLGAMSEQDGRVAQFLTLLLKEEQRQGASGRDAITITDTQCKP